jgi:hypothetical protein
MKMNVIGVIKWAEFISDVIWDGRLLVVELEDFIGHGHWPLSLGR